MVTKHAHQPSSWCPWCPCRLDVAQLKGGIPTKTKNPRIKDWKGETKRRAPVINETEYLISKFSEWAKIIEIFFSCNFETLVATLKPLPNKQSFLIFLGTPKSQKKSRVLLWGGGFMWRCLAHVFAPDSGHAPHSPPHQSHPVNWQSCLTIWQVAPRSPGWARWG